MCPKHTKYKCKARCIRASKSAENRGADFAETRTEPTDASHPGLGPERWQQIKQEANAGRIFIRLFNWRYNEPHINGRAYPIDRMSLHRYLLATRYEDFAECFALWCNEHPDGSSAVFGQISRHMESLISVRSSNYPRLVQILTCTIQDNCEEVFAEYNLKENIDSLHAVVTDARARKQNGQTSGEDVWRENIEPRAAVRARTIPLLQAEAERLRATLLEVCSHRLWYSTISQY